MTLMTLQILFQPATNAIGKPRIALRIAMMGAGIVPVCVTIGLNWGVTGLAWGWSAGMAILAAVTAFVSMPAIGLRRRSLPGAIAPGLAASAAMAFAVIGLDSLLPVMAPAPRLFLLAGFGAALYGALVIAFARAAVADLMELLPERLRRFVYSRGAPPLPPRPDPSGI